MMLKNMTEKSGQILRNLMIVGVLAVVSSTPALAFSDNSECQAAIASAESNLLKVSVSDDELAKIFDMIDAARNMCASEDFAGATKSLDVAKSLLAAAAPK